MTARALRFVVLVAGLLGIVTCHFLIQGHLNALSGAITDGFLCGGGRLDCGRLALHPASMLLGFPLPIWGLAYFLFVSAIAVAVIVHDGAERKAWAAFGGMVTTLAFVFDLYLGYLMISQVGVVCVKCAATYALNLVLLVCFHLIDRSIREPVRWSLLFPDFRRFSGEGGPGYYRNVIRTTYWAGLLLAGSLAVVLATRPFQKLQAKASDQMQQMFTDVFMKPPRLHMDLFDGQPTIGPTSASVHAALIGDFQCSFCRAMARNLEALRERRPRDIRVSFVNFPLQASCNPSLRQSLHPDACWLAEAGEGLAAQDKFWEYHDRLFERLPFAQVDRAHVERAIAEMAVDTAAFRRSMNDGSAAAGVARDLELCRTYDLEAAPILVVNGYVIRGAVMPSLLSRVVAFLLKDAEPPATTPAPAPPH